MNKYNFFTAHMVKEEDEPTRRIQVFFERDEDNDWILEYIKPDFLFDFNELHIFCFTTIRKIVKSDNFSMSIKEKIL